MKINDPDHWLEFEMFRKVRHDEYFGIFCASMSFDILKMWERFADRGKGFAIGLKLNRILLDDRIMGSCGPVEYYPLHNQPKVSPFTFNLQETIERHFREVLSVPDLFEYENEFRIVRTNRQAIGNVVLEYDEKDRIIELPESYFQEVLLGHSMNKEDKEELIECAKKAIPTVPVYITEIRADKVVKTKMV